jgi:DNA replication and repair protein RecF
MEKALAKGFFHDGTILMHIHSLTLKNFRNIEKTEIFPDPEFNILWGPNAQGKTNFLEAVYLLGNLKSFRAFGNQEMPNHKADEARILARISSGGVSHGVELTIGRNGKSARLNGKQVKKTAGFFGYLRPILFSPEEVNLLKGYPAGRRALLDRAVFQADPNYLVKAQAYDRCLKQRNRLLKDGNIGAELTSWTDKLLETGFILRRERISYLQRIRPLFQETYSKISAAREKADFYYSPAENSDEDIKKSFRLELERERERERRLGQTLAGPHRDNPEFVVDGRSARLYASQGQQRSLVLAFKTAQIMDLEARTGEPPVLLLDDMTSELDRQRQEFFFRFLLSRKGQVFITTTEKEPLLQAGLDNGRFFRVSNGAFEEETEGMRSK